MTVPGYDRTRCVCGYIYTYILVRNILGDVGCGCAPKIIQKNALPLVLSRQRMVVPEAGLEPAQPQGR